MIAEHEEQRRITALAVEAISYKKPLRGDQANRLDFKDQNQI